MTHYLSHIIGHAAIRHCSSPTAEPAINLQYYYVDKLLTWPQAQQYCREHYTDLATFESMDDINRLEPNISYSWAWIGLWDDPNVWQSEMGNESNSWRWSATGETSKTGYQSWATGDPDFGYSGEMCALMVNNTLHKWGDERCQAIKVFICEQGDC
uniref:C-type lectin domain-containing protein n=1 Tax=Poecilia reticulata TaxID=8081 RepID=A0A3P9MYW3_POERE